MKKIYFLFLSIFTITFSAFSAPYFWIGGAAGNWNSAANWSATSGGAAGTLIPGANDDVTFNTGTTIAVTYDASALSIGFKTFSVINNTQLSLNYNSVTTRSFGINNTAGVTYEVIQAGSSLTLRNAANGTFEFASTNGRCVFNGDFKCIVTSVNTSRGPRLNATSDTIEINALAYTGDNGTNLPTISPDNFTGAKFRWKSTGIFQLDRRAGTIPGGAFDALSLIKITGVKDAGPSTFSSPTAAGYGSLEWNCPNQTTTINPSLSSGTIFQGNWRIVNTGTVSFRPASTANISINGDLIIEGGTLSMGNSTTASTWNINGKILQTGGILDLQGSSANTTVKVKGEIKQALAGVITETGSSTATTLELVGIANQNISILTSGITQDITLKINNGTGATALTDITLPNSVNAILVFTNGNLDMLTNNKLLFVQNPASSACITGTGASHLIGKMKRSTNLIGSYHFPVSSNATDIPKCLITPDAAVASDFTVEFLNNNPNRTAGLTATIIDEVANYVWDIQRAVGGPTARISLGYGGYAANTIASPTTAKVVHWSGSVWEDKGGTPDVVPLAINAISSNTGCNDFSPYSIGGPVGVLPLSVEYFSGLKNGNGNTLDWKINCTNITEVTIELQRSNDSRNYRGIYSEVATSVRCLQAFVYNDASPVAGINYYRLKLTEPNGTVKYSSIIALINKDKGYEIVSLAPNPARANATLTLSSAKAGKVDIVITDVVGKVISKQQNTLVGGNNIIPMNFEKLSIGSYNIVVTSADGEVKTTRFVKY